MRHRLAEGMAFRLQLLAGLAPLLPGLRVLFGVIADLLPPGGAIGDLQTDDGIGYGKPFLAVIGDRLRGFIKPALRLADLLGDVADIDDAVGVKLRPIVDRADDVGTGAGRYGRGDARLDRQPVDAFEIDLDAEVLLGQLVDLGSDRLVRKRHVIGAPDPVQGRSLGESGGSSGSQNPGEAAGRGGSRAGAG